MDLPRLTGPVSLDGWVDEEAWARIAPLELTTYAPTWEAPPTERSEIRVAYDDEHVWVSALLSDTDPSGIRINSLSRDRPSGDDELGIVLDTFHDRETALWFSVNPAGVRFDRAISNDAEGGFGTQPVNLDWNGVWHAATRLTAEGWSAELRIPLATLGFEPVGDRVTMGLIVYRRIARHGEIQTHPSIPPDWRLGFAKPSRARPVVLHGVRAGRPILATPFGLTGARLDHEQPVENGPFRASRNSTAEAGLDVKIAVRPQVTVDLTVNTDFAQVEVDDQQVNLSRFSLFFPEKRRFFQERANLFDFGTGDFDRLFHSRRIGLHQGEAVPILAGGRLVGRVGGWDLGVLSMQTTGTDGTPSTNFGVVGVRKPFEGGATWVGGMVTSRVPEGGATGLAAGLDARVALSGGTFVTAQIVQTARAGAVGGVRRGLFRARVERPGQRGWSYGVDVSRIGEEYAPDVGFVQRRGAIRVMSSVGHGWSRGAESRFRTISPTFAVVRGFFRTEDRSLESGFLGHFLNVTWRSGSFGWVGLRTDYEDLREDLRLPESTTVPAGSYAFPVLTAGHMPSRTRTLDVGARGQAGRFYDGWRLTATVEPVWNASRHLELSADVLGDHVRFPQRSSGFTVFLARLRAQLALDRRLSASTFVQVNSAARVFVPSVRIRYNFGEGSDLWLVYDELINLERDRTDPRLPWTQSRAFMAKLTHTFRVG